MFHLHQYISLIIDLIGSEVYHYSCVGNNNQTQSPEYNTLMVPTVILTHYANRAACLSLLTQTFRSQGFPDSNYYNLSFLQ